MLDKFVEKTGSVLGKSILDDWENQKKKFIKVFPLEYKTVLKNRKSKVVNILKRHQKSTQTVESASSPKDIEDLLPDLDNLDKLRGFVKYKRIKGYYRKPETRLNEWGEIYDFPEIKKNVRVQASR